uniref:Uncharacterized protein n=1 Tax=Chlamydomonas euryale TaxID=1486919 RepID=A0A7R9YTL3_9CHLO
MHVCLCVCCLDNSGKAGGGGACKLQQADWQPTLHFLSRGDTIFANMQQLPAKASTRRRGDTGVFSHPVKVQPDGCCSTTCPHLPPPTLPWLSQGPAILL